MLKKFNQLFNKIIFENTEEEQQYNKYIQAINTSDAFFRTYIQTLAEKCQITPIKTRYNVFRLYGIIENIINFFNTFKVNKQFMPDTSKFQILAPLISFCENEHRYNKNNSFLTGPLGTQGETLNTYLDNTLETFNNQKEINKNIYGKWFDLITYKAIQNDQTLNEIQKALTPKQTANALKEITKLFKQIDNPIYIEFTVNTEKLPNNSFEELAKAVPITDGNITLSDTINSRKDVINPIPNQNVLGTINTSIPQEITKENNKSVKKSVKTKTNNFNNKNKVKIKK